MALYRFYYVDEFGHVFDRCQYDGDNDLQALDAAQHLTAEHGIEIWSGDRFITRFKQGGVSDVETIEEHHEDPLALRDRADKSLSAPLIG
jgi:hypothetical protein